MSAWRNLWNRLAVTVAFTTIGGTALASNRGAALASVEGMQLSARLYADGTYSISAPGISSPVIHSDVEAVVDSVVLRSTDYPHHRVERSESLDKLGPASTLTVTHTGLVDRPDLVCVLTLMRDQAWGDIAVKVQNTTDRTISVKSIRSVQRDWCRSWCAGLCRPHSIR